MGSATIVELCDTVSANFATLFDEARKDGLTPAESLAFENLENSIKELEQAAKAP